MIVSRQAKLSGAQRQLALQQDRLASLEIRSNRAGIVIPPPNIPVQPVSRSALATWSGSPFDAENQGALMEEGTWFCSIGRQNKWEAVLMVPQSEIRLIRTGDQTRLMLDEFPGSWFQASVEYIGQDKVESLPRELTRQAGGPIDTAADGSKDAPLFDYYQVTARIIDDQPLRQLGQGFRGRARVKVGKYTVAWRLSRFFKTVFNFS